MHLVLVLDSNKADELADFWAAALSYRRDPFEDPYARLTDPAGNGPALLIQQVPEPKSGKNRMHLDIHVPDMDSEVARLTGLGAETLKDAHLDDGALTTIMADPDGNEFCVAVRPEDSS